MRRNSRKKEKKSVSDKIIMYSGIGVAILAIIVVALLVYSKNLSDNMNDEALSLEEIAKLTGNTTENAESASTDIGKSVEESKNEINNTANEGNATSTNTNADTNIINNTTKNNTTNNAVKNTTNNNTTTKTTTTNAKDEKNLKEETENKELNFQMPVDGETVREYAKDNLIYSETLQEWTTHMGIDIKADKTTVVKAAEEGTVKSIKNDPRYGLTIVIEHSNNFQTVYSNLLTSEFVVEGEKVEKGQSIGTVGNTAIFETADEPHLHFEILKDSMQVDPSIYIK